MTGATLFSGFDGAGIGMEAAGIRVLWGLEWDDAIASVARANGQPVRTGDVTLADPADFPAVDCLHMSPVCKQFSVANPNAGELESDREAARACVRFVEHMRPAVVTVENVWGYRKSESWQIIYSALRRLGYGVGFGKLNAADYGVPQTRERMIVWALRDGRVLPVPTPTHAENPPEPGLFGDVLPRWIGWHEAIADLIPDLPESQLAPWQLKRLPEELRTVVIGENPNARGDCRRPDEPMKTIAAQPAGGLPRALLVHPTEQRTMPTRSGERPAFTAMAQAENTNMPRALLVSNAKTEWSDGQRDEEEPGFSVTGESGGRVRAVLVGTGGFDGGVVNAPVGKPSFTVTANQNQGDQIRAVLVEQNANDTSGASIFRDGAAPSGTIRTGLNHVARAVLVSGDSVAGGDVALRTGDDAAVTVTTKSDRQRAVLVDGKLGDRSTSLSTRDGESPALTVTTSHNNRDAKAVCGVRTVQMTPRCLARFQSFPDTYTLPESRALACTGIGNAVAPLLMQRVYEHVLAALTDQDRKAA